MTEMLINSYIAMLILVGLITSIPFVLGILSRALSSKIYQMLLNIIFCLSELYLLLLFLFLVLTFFIYSIPSVVITVWTYFKLRKSPKVEKRLKIYDNRFQIISLKAVLVAGPFLVLMGITFVTMGILSK
jgi:hypothetical protein